MLPFTSLDAAGSPGAGAVLDLGRVEGTFTAIVWATGNPTGQPVDLEGSHDGAHWIVLQGGLGAGYVASVNDGPLVRFARANLRYISGGTSPTFTVTIACGGSDAD